MGVGRGDETKNKQCTLVEKHTREQAKSHLWFQICAGCMTSKLHHVCHTNPVQPALSLIAGVCSQNTNCRPTQAMQWGIDHEDIAGPAMRKSRLKVKAELSHSEKVRFDFKSKVSIKAG